MTRYLMLIILTCTGLTGWPQTAGAVNSIFSDAEEEPPQPPQEMPPLPPDAMLEDDLGPPPEEQQPPPAYGGNYYPQQVFPALPPSRPCVTQDLTGIWRLVSLYEEPYGAEAANFAAQPYQYLMFEKSSIYSRYNSATVKPTPGMLAESANRQDFGLHQYLLNDAGVIYFYSQGVAVDSQACFIVANERGEFKLGQMLLIPPKGHHPGRMVKIYARQRSGKKIRVPGSRR